jgi:S-adenosylmethionine-diacylglycerol 3-amino-3-carboxypropyl transferase
VGKVPDNAPLTELAGLPLTILQSVAFVMAAQHADWLSMLLFLWWGPGFVTVLALLVIARLRQRRIDWHPFRYLISYLCKVSYLAYMVTFYLQNTPGIMFAFSVWIINDQYEKAFMSLDTDRTRRTLHDGWLFRMLYPAGLLIPLFVAETPLRPFSIGYGLGLLGLWIAGLVYVWRVGEFLHLPKDPSLLRNMVYFPKLRVGSAPRAEKRLAAKAPRGGESGGLTLEMGRGNTLPPWALEAALLPVAFAQVREDPLIDAWVVKQLSPDARIIMIASGGCTLAFLAAACRLAQVDVVDPNPAQIALTRLKLHLLQHCDSPERLALLGHAPMPTGEREDRLRAALKALDVPAEALGPPRLWAADGPDHTGRYERVFGQLRRGLEPHAVAVKQLLSLRDPAEQVRRTAQTTNLGKALDQAFAQAMDLPILVHLFGEGATRNRVEPFARHFARRTRHVLETLPAATNPYLWQVLAGGYPPGEEAPWLTAPSPDRLPKITWNPIVMVEALRHSPGSYDFVHLSNVLDWLSPEEARVTLAVAHAALRPGGWAVIRQLNSTLDIPSLGERLSWQTEEAQELHARDRSYFYRGLHLGRKR